MIEKVEEIMNIEKKLFILICLECASEYGIPISNHHMMLFIYYDINAKTFRVW